MERPERLGGAPRRQANQAYALPDCGVLDRCMRDAGIERRVQVTAIDLHEDRPPSVARLCRLPCLNHADLIRVVDEDPHGRAHSKQLIGERRKVRDLVGGHGKAIENLRSSC